MCLKSQGDESSLNKAMTEIASSLDYDIRDVSKPCPDTNFTSWVALTCALYFPYYYGKL